MELSQALMEQVEAYLQGRQPVTTLAEWLLTYTEHFATLPRDDFAAQLWAHARLLIDLWDDGVLDEEQVRTELRSFLFPAVSTSSSATSLVVAGTSSLEASIQVRWEELVA